MLPKRMSAIPSTTTGASNSVHRCLDMLADIEDTDAHISCGRETDRFSAWWL